KRSAASRTRPSVPGSLENASHAGATRSPMERFCVASPNSPLKCGSPTLAGLRTPAMSSMSNLALKRDEQPETPLQSAVLRTVEVFADVQERSERERATYASIVARSFWRMFGDVLVVEEAEEVLRRAA